MGRPALDRRGRQKRDSQGKPFWERARLDLELMASPEGALVHGDVAVGRGRRAEAPVEEAQSGLNVGFGRIARRADPMHVAHRGLVLVARPVFLPLEELDVVVAAPVAELEEALAREKAASSEAKKALAEAETRLTEQKSGSCVVC